MDIQKRMDELVAVLNEANYQYYALDDPKMLDFEYDHLLRELEDLEKDLDENGWTEPFQQSTSIEPYDRKRPNADLYISLSAQYTRTMKQLDSMLPKGIGSATDDELIDFLA